MSAASDWSGISSDPSFQAQSPDVKNTVANNFFTRHIAPNVPAEKMDGVRQSFMSTLAPAPRGTGPSGYAADSGAAPNPAQPPNMTAAGIVSAFKNNVLSNDPVQGGAWSGGMERALPASVGAGIGGGLGGAVAGPPGAVWGAGVGGTAGEGMRQLAINLRNLSNGQAPTPAVASLDSIGQAGVDQAAGQEAGEYITSPEMIDNVYAPAAQKLKDLYAAGAKNFAGIPEELTNWARYRGPKEILTPANAEPIAQQNALEGMRSDMIGQKKAAGTLVGTAEDQFANTPAASMNVDASPIAAAVRGELQRPIFRPAALPFGGGAAAEKGLLEGLATHMEGGPATGLDILGAKKNLARGVDWNGSPVPDPSPDFQRIQKGIGAQFSGVLNNADPQGIGVANPNFGQADDLYSAHQSMLGDVPKPGVNNDANTISRLKIMMGKGGAQAGGLTNFDAAVGRSRESSLGVRDALAASAPEPTPAPTVADRSPILAQKMQALKDAEVAASAPPAPVPAAAQPVAPATAPTPGSASAASIPNPAPSPGLGAPDPLTGGREPLPSDILSRRPSVGPAEDHGVPAGYDRRSPAEQFIDARNAPPAPEPPLTPVQRLRAAQASVQAEQARAAAPASAAAPGRPAIPLQNAPEGPGWLDKPAGTPGRDMQDALTAAAFYGKSDPARSPSSVILRALGTVGPASMARLGLQLGQTGAQAAQAAAPAAGAAMPAILARILAARRSAGGK